MSIMLGNLSVSDIEKRTGVDFPEDIRKFMSENHAPSASHFDSGKWHCFDIPFTLVCADYETALKIYDSVKDKSKEFKIPLNIALRQGDK